MGGGGDRLAAGEAAGYLAPNGAGDALLAGAAVIRNWIAIQTVMVTLVLAIFLLAQIVRMAVASGLPRCVGCGESVSHYLPWGYVISWSPFSIVAAVVFLVLAAPPLWAYWMVEGHIKGVKWIHPLWGLGVAAALSYGGLKCAPDKYHARGISAVVLIVAALTFLSWFRAQIRCQLSPIGKDP